MVQPSTLIGSDLVRFYESTKMLSLVPMCVTGILGGFFLLVVTIGELCPLESDLCCFTFAFFR